MSRGKKTERNTSPGRPLLVATARRAADSQPVVSKPAGPRRRKPREGCYVYGVIESGQPIATFGKSNIGGVSEDVYAIPDGGLAAVVSRTPVFILDPTRDNVLAHERVTENVMKDHTIIPMSFGTVFRGDEDVREMLRSADAPLREALRQMAGKVEFGLKVTWDRDRIIEDLKREHDEIHRFHRELTRRHLQSTYFARIELGRMMEKALGELTAGYVHEIYDGLRTACVALRETRPIGEKMILNAAFLVLRKREAEFEAALKRTARKFQDRLHFKLTGPWPPYNFVEIRLKVEQRRAG